MCDGVCVCVCAGVSLPLRDAHAVGVSLPRWEDVVGYEEGEERVLEALTAGYPRFVYLPDVRRLFDAALERFSDSDGPGRMAQAALAGVVRDLNSGHQLPLPPR